MNRFLAALLLALPLTGPAFAMGDAPPAPAEQPAPVQEPPAIPAPDAPESPPGDLEAGIEDFMRNMLREAQPHLDNLGNDLGGMVSSLGPVLSEIGTMIDDVRNYQTPEMLENGDIIIRRRADAPPRPEMGPNLRQMMRPNPDTPRGPAPDQDAPDQNAPARDPASEIEL